MEAIRTLVRGDLPPVGRPIIYFGDACGAKLPDFEGYFSSWVDSGTSALALAFLQAKSCHPDIVSPEVILPGYCCPDLVAAAHFAGLIPRIVDINVNDPSLNIDAVRRYVSKNTIAIVAINFLGIAENLDELLSIKGDYPQISIIEDNAQWFPYDCEKKLLRGDFVAFSFGRGKPVSLLGGGLLLSKYPFSADFLQTNIDNNPSASALSRLILAAKYTAYNQLLSPFLYQFLSRNPFLKLGTTQYHSLDKISLLDSQRMELLPYNLEAFHQAENSMADKYSVLFSEIGFDNQLNVLGSDRCRRLLRYPVLFSTVEQKVEIFDRLVALGLGATEMYRSELPLVTGVCDIAICGRLENAISFASRLITLPTHLGVTSKHLSLIKDAFKG